MTSSQTWVEALKISPEKLSEWSTLAPEDKPLLVWCLQNGHVSTEEYLEWASEAFGLPILNSAFFHQSFDRASLTSEIRQGPWTAWCFPVSKWEDVEIVACIEPPAEQPEGKFSFVLADPAVMNEVWGEPGAEPVPELDAPVGVNLNASKSFVLNMDDLTSAVPDHSEPTLSVVKEPEAKPKVALPPIPEAAKPQPKPAAKTSAKVAQAPAVSEDSEIHSSFERLKGDYNSVLIMRCTDTLAKPYKWDGDLKIDPATEASNVMLTNPSFFRIVAKTMQPYHGYIVDSPAHREFFGSLHFETAPACVTAIPLKANGKLWGMLVAFGDETAQTAESLDSAMQVADKLTKSFEHNWAKAA